MSRSRRSPMLVIHTGFPSPSTGYFADDHGHCLFIRRGELAPICMYSGPATMRWRLVREIAGD
jgi:hypothetical protein